MPRLSKQKQYEKRLEKNIIKFAWYKIFTKRVYLPLIAIQLVSVGQVTIEEIALIAIITSAIVLLLQLPTGYFADRFGKRTSMIVGAVISAPSPLFYVFMPDFTGGLLASLLFFGGYAFQSGAVEAFMHDTLKALRRESDYAKVMGRAQSYGLIGNIILLALIPATYAIDTNLPFILGFFSLVAMVWLVVSFEYPKENAYEVKLRDPFGAVRSIVTVQNIALFLFAGFLTGVSNVGGQYRDLLMQDVGIAVSIFGFIYAAGSILGAVFGFMVPLLDRLKPLTFYAFDLVLLSSLFVVIGLGDPILIVISSIIAMAYFRVRMIVFQSKLLANLTHTYKSSLLSALSAFTTLGEIAVVGMLAWSIGALGYASGYFVFGLCVLGIGGILWLGVLRSLTSHQNHASKGSN